MSISTSVYLSMGRHEKGLSPVKDSPLSYMEVTERRGPSETIEKEERETNDSLNIAVSRALERVSELQDGGSSRKGPLAGGDHGHVDRRHREDVTVDSPGGSFPGSQLWRGTERTAGK